MAAAKRDDMPATLAYPVIEIAIDGGNAGADGGTADDLGGGLRTWRCIGEARLPTKAETWGFRKWASQGVGPGTRRPNSAIPTPWSTIG